MEDKGRTIANKKFKNLCIWKSIKVGINVLTLINIAEDVGFEPTVHCCTLVFKTSAFDHSAISPVEGVLLPKWAANLNRI